jgi:hypothetical protein
VSGVTDADRERARDALKAVANALWGDWGKFDLGSPGEAVLAEIFAELRQDRDRALAERDEARRESEGLRGIARTAKDDAECAADAVDALRRIGETIGCEHADGPDDRARLVRCVRDSLASLRARLAEAEAQRDAIVSLLVVESAAKTCDGQTRAEAAADSLAAIRRVLSPSAAAAQPPPNIARAFDELAELAKDSPLMSLCPACLGGKYPTSDEMLRPPCEACGGTGTINPAGPGRAEGGRGDGH